MEAKEAQSDPCVRLWDLYLREPGLVYLLGMSCSPTANVCQSIPKPKLPNLNCPSPRDCPVQSAPSSYSLVPAFSSKKSFAPVAAQHLGVVTRRKKTSGPGRFFLFFYFFFLQNPRPQRSGMPLHHSFELASMEISFGTFHIEQWNPRVWMNSWRCQNLWGFSTLECGCGFSKRS